MSGANRASGAHRILILSAEIGEGHVTVARALAERLRERESVGAVGVRTDLKVMGERFGAFMELGFHAHLDGIAEPDHWLQRLSYGLGYRLFFERSLPRRAGQLALAALGGRCLRRTIAQFGADLVVTEYPVLSAALGELRALGRLPIPVYSAISDPAGLWYWAHPGIDLHLLSWPESLPEVERIAGSGRAVVVRPLIDRRIVAAPPREQARATLGLQASGPILLISGGGWGIGDLPGAVEVALGEVPDAQVVALAGRSAQARQRLLAAHDGNPRVRVLGFTEQMPELLAAADLIVHTTGGTTALEARIAGCRLINYDTSVIHVRAHARALRDQGLALWAQGRRELASALTHALSQPPPPRLRIDDLPDAADVVMGAMSPPRSVALG